MNPGAIQDASGLDVDGIFVNNALQASNVINDTTPPELSDFLFDLDSGVLSLTFSEVVSAESVQANQFSLQSDVDGGDVVTLTGGTLTEDDARVINITLLNADLNKVKSVVTFGIDVNTTYLYYTGTALRDTSRVFANEVPSTAAKKATSFIQDTSPPVLNGFDLLTSGNELQVRLYFNEIVNASTLNLTSIQLFSDQSSDAVNYTFLDVMVSASISSTISFFAETSDVENILSLPPLGQTIETTFITLPYDGITDVSDNSILAISPEEAVKAFNITADFLPPSLSSFEIDLTAELLYLTFSEAVNASTINTALITLQSTKNDSTVSVTLSDSQVTAMSSSVILVHLTASDLNEIKATTNLATRESNVFLSAASNFAFDTSGITNTAIEDSDALAISDFEPDRKRPNLTGFDLDLSTNRVTLTFSETVNVSTFNPRLLAFQSSQFDDSVSVTLTGQNDASRTLNNVIEFTLVDADKNAITRSPQLAISADTTYITLASDGIYDMNNNRLLPVTSLSARRVSTYTGDNIRPTASSFAFDLNTGIIRITFDETVNVSTFVITNIQLSANSTDSSSSNYSLTTSSITTGNTHVVEIMLSSEDFNAITKLTDLCTNDEANNCYLSFPENTTEDMAGHGVYSFDEPAATVINDTKQPEFLNFISFSLETGEMSIQFTETVLASSFQPQYLILQSLHDRPLETYQIELVPSLPTENSDILTFTLSSDDLFNVKDLSHVCVYRGNCYIKSNESLLMDMSGNTLKKVEDESPGYIVDNLLPDTTGPVLTETELDMDNGTVSLKFDEPITPSSLTITGVTIQSATSVSSPSDSLTLSDSTYSVPESNRVLIKLTTNNLNVLKNSNYATDSSDSFIVIAANTVTDVALTPNANLASGNGTQVDVFVNDTTPPRLQSFSLDLQSFQLMLTFDEPVSTAINPLGFTLRSNCSDGASSFTLSGGTGSDSPSSIVELIVTLIGSDVTKLKIDTTVATEIANTYLAITNGSVQDLSMNEIEDVECIGAGQHEAAGDILELLNFDLDMNTGVLFLTFSDIASSTTFNPVGIVIQSGSNRDDGPSYRLTEGTRTNSSNGDQLTVMLSSSDFLNIKSLAGVATSMDDTYLTLRASVIDDTSGRDVLAITDGKAKQVTNFITDSIEPSLQSFSLDLNTGVLNLTFSEGINISTLVLSDIQLQSEMDEEGTEYSLTGGTAVRSENGFAAIITLSSDDLNNIKALTDLATNNSNTFISFSSSAIADLFNNSVIAINSSNARQVLTYESDTTSPELISYSIDMDSAILNLTFSETVDISSLDITSISLQDSRNITASATLGSYTLTSSTVSSLLSNTLIQLQLSNTDLYSIQNVSSLATNAGNTFISVLSTAISDNDNNSVSILSNADALPVQPDQFTPDVTNPEILGFELDLNNRFIELTFSELVPLSSFNANGLTLQNTSSEPVLSNYTLSCSTFECQEFTVCRVRLCNDDLFALTLDRDLATFENNTFLVIASSAFSDSFGNAIIPVSSSSPLNTTTVVQDTNGPELVGFTFDLNSTRLLLTFDEVIDVSTFSIAQVTLQANDTSFSSDTAYTLQSSLVTTDDSHIVIISLSIDDTDGLVLKSQLATDRSNTFINITSDAFTDYYRNDFDGLTEAFQAIQYIPDTAPPILDSFTVDLNERQLILNFTESVIISTLQITGITLQNSDGTQTFTLTSSSYSNSTDGNEVVVTIGQTDFNSIASNTGLLTAIDNSYISLASSSVYDASNNPIAVLASKQASDYIPDRVEPELNRFTLDIDSGVITLTFSETVDLTKLDPTGISIVHNQSNSDQVVRLSRATPMIDYAVSIEFDLVDSDLNAIKADTQLATMKSNSYVNLIATSVRDMANNTVVPIALLADEFMPDDNQPTLEEFRVDFQSRELILTFSETVDASSIQITRAHLQSQQSRSGGETPLTFTTSSTATVQSFNKVVIDLSLSDYTNILDSGLCTSLDNCYIIIDSTFINDTSLHRVRAISDGEAVKAVNITDDTSRPTLLQYATFDFNTGEVILSFSEEVRTSTINLTTISVHQSHIIGAPGVDLDNATYSIEDNSTVVLKLRRSVLNEIKLNTLLCRQESSCFIRFSSYFIEDPAGNQVLPVLATGAFVTTERANSIISDTTPPQLLSYDLNMDTLALTFTFDEIVDAAVLEETELTFQDASSYNTRYTLTDLIKITDTPSDIVSTTLTVTDSIYIKANLDLATEAGDTYITYNTSLIRDTGAGKTGTRNNISPRENGNGLRVDSYVPDQTPPSTITFTLLDIDAGIMRIEANEPLSNDVIFTNITLQQSSTGGTNYTLTGGSISYTDINDKREIIINLANEDVQAIKLEGNIGTAQSNSHLFMSYGTLSDTAGNDAIAIPSSSAIQVVSFIGDTTPPLLTNYTLDMDEGIVTLTFNDIVNGAGVSNTEMTFLPDSNATNTVSVPITGGSSSDASDFTVQVTLNDADLNAIRVITDLGTNIFNTYLLITADFVSDLAGIGVVRTVQRATALIRDDRPPSLTDFELNIDTQSLILSFSEAIEESSFNITDIRLQRSTSDLTNSVVLTGGTIITMLSNKVFNITLLPADLNRIKGYNDLGTNSSNTYISFPSTMAQDFFDNSIIEIDNDDAKRASDHGIDMTPPRLTNFTFDANLGRLVLTFSETVSTHTLEVNRFTLQDSATSPTYSYNLTSGVYDLTNTVSVTIALSAVDRNAVKNDLNLATSRSNTFLRNSFAAVEDTTGLQILALDIAIQADDYIFDQTPPELEQFTLDLNTSQLLLTFSESVDPDTLDPTGITIQSSSDSPTVFVELEDATVISSLGRVLQIELTESDANQIKLAADFGTTISNTFLLIANGTINDTDGNALIASDRSLPASQIIPDTTSPQLRPNFTINLNTGIFTLTFNEVIDKNSFNFSRFTFLPSVGSSETITLTGGQVQPFNTSVVTVRFARQDINALKLDSGLCSSLSNCFLDLASGAVTDIAGQPLAEPATPLIAVSIVNDTTAPSLETWDFIYDGNSNNSFQLILHFDEPVKVATGTTDITLITLSDANNTINHTLSSSNFIINTESSPDVTIAIAEDDIELLLLSKPILQDTESTYIQIDAGAFEDLFGFDITTTDLIMITTLTGDYIEPSLDSFVLDLNEGALLLTFSEDVDVTTVNVSNAVLQDTRDRNINFVRVPSDSVVEQGDTLRIVKVSLDILTQNRLLEIGIGQSVNSTFISLEQGFVRDISSIKSLAVPENNGERASDIIADSGSSQLVQFSFQFDPDIISLTFTKSIDVSTFDVTYLMLQNAPGRNALSYTLTNASVSPTDSTQVKLTLSEEDSNALRAINQLATEVANTYISFSSFMASGLNGQAVSPISPINPRQAFSVGNDTAQPRLLSFDLDLNEGILTLSFDETINITTLNITTLTVQNTMEVTADSLTLTNGTYDNQNTEVLSLTLSTSDIDFIKSNSLCQDSTSCFLSVTTSTVRDMAGFQLIANTLMVSALTLDTSSPLLVEFVQFDLIKGQLTLLFNEPIDNSTINITGLRLQSLFEDPVSNYTLTDFEQISVTGRTVIISMSDTDIVSIKKMSSLCSTRGNCYAYIDSSFATDFNNNSISLLSNVRPGHIVSQLIDDNMLANITSFTLDMNANTLTLTFDEPVDAATLNAIAITIQAVANTTNTSLMYTLTGGNTASPNGKEIVIELLSVDVNELKRSSFATSRDSTYISVSSHLIYDNAFYANPTQAISSDNALQAANHVPDTTPPHVVSFTLDLNDDRIIITFNEPVKVSTLDISDLTIANDSSLSADGVSLSDGTIIPADLDDGATVITVSFTLEDVARLKLNTDGHFDSGYLTTHTYLLVTNYTITDMNDIYTVENYTRVTNVISDDKQARVLSFNLDMDIGQLNITFSDVIDTNTFQPSGVTLQSSMTAVQGQTYSLKDSSVVGTDSQTVIINLSIYDRIGVSEVLGLATNENDTYLTLRANTFDDYAGVDVIAVTDGNALKVTQYTPDDTGIELVYSSLDMNLGTLLLSFSDILNQSTFRITDLQLLNAIPTPSDSFALTEGDVVRSNDALNLTITLSQSDLNILKNKTTLAISRNTTFVSITENIILDLAGNGIPQTVQIVDDFTPDETSPQLISFNFDLDGGILNLTFSETINLTSFDPSQLDLQKTASSNNDSVNITSEAEVTLINLVSVSIQLTDDTIDAIKLIEGLGTSESLTYITATENLVTDKNDNTLQPINSSVALRATFVIEDDTMPRLINYTLDLNDGLLLLTFSEAVNGSTFNVSSFTLGNSQSPTTNYTLQVSPSSPLASGTELSLLLGAIDLDGIQGNTLLATSADNTYLSALSTGVKDANANPLLSISTDNALKVSNYVPDTSPPTLNGFTLDLNTLQLILSFSEIIPVSSFDVNAITLMSNATGEESYTLQSVYSLTEDTRRLIIQLSIADTESIQLNPDLGNTINDTFINITASSFRDFANNNFTGLPEPLMADSVIADKAPPSLVSFDFDLNTGLLSLQFNEPINVDNINIGGFTFYTAEGTSGASVRLDSSTVSTEIDSSLVNITLSTDDLNSIKHSLTLATNSNNTYISIASSTVQDVSSVNIRALDPPGEIVDVFTADTTGPEITSFDFDLDAGLLKITFDEIIDAFSPNASGFSLVNSRIGPEEITFSSSQSEVATNNFTVLFVTLSTDDLNSVKANRALASNDTNTFLTATSVGVRDVANQTLQPVLLSNAINVTNFTADTTNPSLRQWLIEIDSGNVTLIFSETVDVLFSMRPAEITIQNTQSSTPSRNITLSTDTVLPTSDSNIVSLTLSGADIIKLFQADLCLNTSACYLSFSSNFVNDMSGNPINPRVGINSVNVNELIIDPNPPEIEQFLSFDFDQGTMTLRFSKTVVPTVRFENITITNSFEFLAGATETVTLTGGTVTDATGPQMTIAFNEADLIQFKSNTAICSSRITCYILFDQGTVNDLAGNAIIGIGFSDTFDSRTRVLQAVIPDKTGPQVTNFDLDLNSNNLILVFDEPVQDVSSSAITITNAFNATLSHTMSTVVETVDDTIVTLPLSANDINVIKSTEGLGTTIDNTYIVYTTSLAQDTGAGESDLVGNDAQARIDGINPLQARSVINDTSLPGFTQFTEFDLNLGRLRLTFSKPVDIDSLVYSNITLLPTAASLTGIALSSGMPSYVPSTLRTSLYITLSLTDLQTVKLDTAIATSVSNTFLRLDSGAFADISGNVYNGSTVLQVVSIPPDTTPARLRQFDFDLDTGLLSLTFDDIVDSSTTDYSQIRFQNAMESPSQTVTLSSGPSLTDVGDVIRFNITTVDLNRLRAIDTLATEKNDTYLRITAVAFRGLDGLNVNGETLIVDEFTGDETSPQLLEFNFNLNDDTLVLSFSEAVNVTRLSITDITLQSSANISEADHFITLSGGTPRPNTTAAVVTITLLQTDLDYIKERRNFGLETSTFLSIPEGAVYDTVGNSIQGISDTSALNVSDHVIDTNPPNILSFTLDLNNGLLNITFNEILLTNLVTVSGFTLTNGASESVSLTGATVVSEELYSSNLVIRLSSDNLNSVKSSTSLGTSMATTFLSLSMGAVQDSSNVPIGTTTGVQADNVFQDFTSPTLLGFSLNIEDGQLLLTFDEAVNATTITESLITLQNVADLTSSSSPITLSLTNSTAVQAVSNTLTITLSNVDLDAIKVSDSFSSDANATFVSFPSDLGSDYNGNPINGVSNQTARGASSITLDVSPPTLQTFTINLNTGTLFLSFNEPINVSNITYGAIRLLSGPDSTNFVILSTGNVTSDNARMFTITLDNDNLDAIKANSILGLSAATTFIAFETGAFTDTRGNPIEEISVSSPRQAGSLIPDTSPPVLVSFDFSMDSGTLPLYIVLHFDEAVNPSTLSLPDLILTDGDSNFTLDRSTIETTAILPDITITIIESDVDEIRGLAPLGQNINTTFLLASNDVVRDASGISYESTSSTISVLTHTADLVRPTLGSFDFDLNRGHLTLSFSEPVLLSSFNQSALSISSNRTISASSFIPSLSSLSSPQPDVILINLTKAELDTLKANTQLAAIANNTYVNIREGITTDPALNLVADISLDSSLKVSRFIPDNTQPQLINFSIVLDDALLALTFSETILASSFDPTGIILQNNESNPSSSYMLSDASFNPINDPVLKLNLSQYDINVIRSISDLATSLDNTFIAISSDTLTDTSSNQVESIPQDDALQAGAVDIDVANPVLLSFDFDVDSGLLTLVFDEYVNITSLDVTEILLMDSLTANATYSLTGASSVEIETTTVTITLTSDDLNAIKLLPLCTVSTDCYISISNTTVFDAVGLSVVPVSPANAFTPTNYTTDRTKPVIVSFATLNLETGVLVLNLSEAVNESSIDLGSLTLQSLFEDPLEQRTLTGGSIDLSTDGTVLSITLASSDINFVKRNRLLCTTRSTCYITATSLFLQDNAGNDIVETAMASPGLLVYRLVIDNAGPVLLDFDLDMDIGLLVLHFNEPIESDSLTLPSITILSSPSNDQSYTLTGGTVLSDDQKDISISLSDSDVTNLKLTNFSKDFNSTYLSALSGYVTDTAYNPNTASAVDALQVDNFTADSTPPELDSYSLDLVNDRLLLTFSEPVLISSFNLSGFTMHSEAMVAGNVQSLADAELSDAVPSAVIIAVYLSLEDIAAVKLDVNFGTERNNTYLSIGTGSLTDTTGNEIEEISDFRLTAFDETGDAILTRLSFYTLDLNIGHLILTFSDAVNVSTQNSPSLRLQSQATATQGKTFTLSSDSISTSPNGYTVDIRLSDLDVLGINSIEGLAKNKSNTYLIMRADYIDDYRGNDVRSITDGKALMVTTFNADTAQPQLTDAILDLKNEVLNLTFDDTVSASSLNFELVTLQNTFNLSNTSESLTLSPGSVIASTDSHTLVLSLTINDMHVLRTTPDFASLPNNTYVVLAPGALSDFFGNPVIEVPSSSGFMVSSIIPDTTRPNLTSFTLDIDTGYLNLTFSETISAESFNISQFTLQSAAGSNEVRYTLTEESPEISQDPGFKGNIIVITIFKNYYYYYF